MSTPPITEHWNRLGEVALYVVALIVIGTAIVITGTAVILARDIPDEIEKQALDRLEQQTQHLDPGVTLLLRHDMQRCISQKSRKILERNPLAGYQADADTVIQTEAKTVYAACLERHVLNATSYTDARARYALARSIGYPGTTAPPSATMGNRTNYPQ